MTPEQISLLIGAISLAVAAVGWLVRAVRGFLPDPDFNDSTTDLLQEASNLAVKAAEQMGGTNENKFLQAADFVLEFMRVNRRAGFSADLARGFIEAALIKFKLQNKSE